MYSRNSQSFRDDFDDVSEEEYELYKYNLPPKYDGSRFRPRRNHKRRAERESDGENSVMTEDVADRDSKKSESYASNRRKRSVGRNESSEYEETVETSFNDITKQERSYSEEYENDEQICKEKSCEEKVEESEKREHGPFDKLLSHIGGKIGSEEFLIISLILLLSGENGAEDSGDIILLLALLLLAG